MQVPKQKNGKGDVFFPLKKRRNANLQIERIQADLDRYENRKIGTLIQN